MGVEKIKFKALIHINKGFEVLFDGVHSPKCSEKLSGDINNAVVVDFSSLEEVYSYVYYTQIANSVSLLLDRKIHFDDLKLPKFSESLLPKEGKFRISSKIGYEEEIGKLFSKYKVDLKNPDFNIELYQFESVGGSVYGSVDAGVDTAEREFFLSLDLSGDLSKRDYKVFNSPLSIKGTTAFGVLMLSDYKKGQSLLDPFCNSGTIEIEAALYSNNISARAYNKDFPFMRLNTEDVVLEKVFKKVDSKAKSDSLNITAADPLLRNITAAKKNAKIAGVEKYINFRRIDIDWMDIKHEEKTFDHIITFIPGSSKHNNPNVLKKEFEKFFYQAEYVIKNNGQVSVLCFSKDLLMESASKYLEFKEMKNFYSGMQFMYLLIFVKGKK